jgi:hypothetical protein
MSNTILHIPTHTSSNTYLSPQELINSEYEYICCPLYNYLLLYPYRTSNFKWLLKSAYPWQWHSSLPTISPHLFIMRILWCQRMPPTICFWQIILLLSGSLKVGLLGLFFYRISLKIALCTMTGAPGKTGPLLSRSSPKEFAFNDDDQHTLNSPRAVTLNAYHLQRPELQRHTFCHSIMHRLHAVITWSEPPFCPLLIPFWCPRARVRSTATQLLHSTSSPREFTTPILRLISAWYLGDTISIPSWYICDTGGIPSWYLRDTQVLTL